MECVRSKGGSSRQISAVGLDNELAAHTDIIPLVFGTHTDTDPGVIPRMASSHTINFRVVLKISKLRQNFLETISLRLTILLFDGFEMDDDVSTPTGNYP